MGPFRLFSVLSGAGSASAAIRNPVENITQKISPQITALANAINSFPASGLTGALTVHTNAQNLVAKVNSATSDAKAAGPFSETEGQDILTELQNLEPTVLNTLSAIVSKKADFETIPLRVGIRLVLSDLQNLNTNVIAFADALIANAPADLVPATTTIKNTIASAFASAIAAYS